MLLPKIAIAAANGHTIGEVYSGLQKSIRRGLETEALYFAKEIANVSVNALKKRICLIALEDTCNLDLTVACFNTELETNKLLDTVIAATKVPKTHISAWLNRYSIECLSQVGEVSAESISQLVSERRELEAAVRGQYLRACKDNYAILEEIVSCWTRLGYGGIEELSKLFKYTNDNPLLWLVLILSEIRPELRFDKTRSILTENIGISNNIIVPVMSELPGWVHDKHTPVGKRLKLGYQHFFDISLQMQNKVYSEGIEPYEHDTKLLYLSNELKSLKVLQKLNIADIVIRPCGHSIPYHITIPVKQTNESGGIKRPREENDIELHPEMSEKKQCTGLSNKKEATKSESPLTFEKLLQAQCITGKHKPRVFFCKQRGDTEDQIWVLKGPLKKENSTEYLMTHYFKETLSIPNAGCMELWLEESVHDGISLPTGWYLLSRYASVPSIFSFDNFKLCTTKLEENVAISTNDVSHWAHDLMSPDMDSESACALQQGALLALAFRKCIGTNDTCCRNFICGEKLGEVISVDDPALFRSTPYMFKVGLSGILLEHYKRALQKHWDIVSNTLFQWKSRIKEEIELRQNKQYVSESSLIENDSFLGPTQENLTFFLNTLEVFLRSPQGWKF